MAGRGARMELVVREWLTRYYYGAAASGQQAEPPAFTTALLFAGRYPEQVKYIAKMQEISKQNQVQVSRQGTGVVTPWMRAQLKKLWLPLCTYMVQPAPLGGPAPAVLLETYLKLSALPCTCA